MDKDLVQLVANGCSELPGAEAVAHVLDGAPLRADAVTRRTAEIVDYQSPCYFFSRLVGRLSFGPAILSNGTSRLPLRCATVR